MSEPSMPLFIVDVYLSLTDANGSSQYGYIVYADSKGMAMRTIFNYFDETDFPTDNIDRYTVKPLEFDGSKVVEMLQ